MQTSLGMDELTHKQIHVLCHSIIRPICNEDNGIINEIQKTHIGNRIEIVNETITLNGANLTKEYSCNA